MGIYVWGTGCGASELIDRGLPRNGLPLLWKAVPIQRLFSEGPCCRRRRHPSHNAI